MITVDSVSFVLQSSWRVDVGASAEWKFSFLQVDLSRESPGRTMCAGSRKFQPEKATGRTVRVLQAGKWKAITLGMYCRQVYGETRGAPVPGEVPSGWRSGATPKVFPRTSKSATSRRASTWRIRGPANEYRTIVRQGSGSRGVGIDLAWKDVVAWNEEEEKSEVRKRMRKKGNEWEGKCG